MQLVSPQHKLWGDASQCPWIDALANRWSRLNAIGISFMHRPMRYTVTISKRVYYSTLKTIVMLDSFKHNKSWQCTEILLLHSNCFFMSLPCCWTTHDSRCMMPLIDGVVNKPLREFVPTLHMLELLDWSKSSPAVHRLLNGAQNSVIDCFCPGYSRPHVRMLNERDVLTSRVWPTLGSLRRRAVLLQGLRTGWWHLAGISGNRLSSNTCWQ